MELLSRRTHLMDSFCKGRAGAWLGRRKQQAARDVSDDESELLNRQLQCELERSLQPFTTILHPVEQQHNVVEEPIVHTRKIHDKREEATLRRNRLNLLPPELLTQILSYVVVVPGSIHIYAPHGNSKHGWRLSLCPESSFDPAWGNCSCRS